MRCKYGLPTDWAGVVFREPAVNTVDVEFMRAGQTTQLVALSVLIDADAACPAYLALEAGLTIGTRR